MQRLGVIVLNDSRAALTALSIAAAGWIVVMASPAAADPAGDKSWIEVSGYRPAIDTKINFSRPGAPGAVIDLESTLGLGNRETLPAVYAGTHIGRHWVVTAEYFALSRSGTQNIGRDITFDGVTYPASASVSGVFDTNVYRATIGYDIVRNDMVEFGAGIGLHATNFKVGLNGQGRIGNSSLQSENRVETFLAPLPTLGVYANFAPSPKVSIRGRVDYLSLHVGDYNGSLINTQGEVGYRVVKNFEIGASYRYVKYNFGVTKPDYSGNVKYGFNGPALFLRANFQ